MVRWKRIQVASMRMRVPSPASLSGVVSCGVGHRLGSDLARLWLWHRLAAAALIRPLAWEPPYATGRALKSKKKKKVPEAVRCIPCQPSASTFHPLLTSKGYAREGLSHTGRLTRELAGPPFLQDLFGHPVLLLSPRGH